MHTFYVKTLTYYSDDLTLRRHQCVVHFLIAIIQNQVRFMQKPFTYYSDDLFAHITSLILSLYAS
jgi:hypothetical protein